MRKLGIQALGFLVAGLLLWGVLAWRDRETLKRFRDEQAITRRDTVIRVLDSTRIVRDTIYLRAKSTFAGVANNPASTKADVVKACSEVVTTCDAVRAINDTLRDSLTKQVAEVKKMKAKKPPRLSAWAEGLYDVIHREPVVRAGADFHLFGPLSVTAAGESSAGMNDSRQRVLVGARFTFR